MLYTHIHADVSRNIMTASINKRTHFFIKKYTSHTLFAKGLRKGWCWLCVRGELETGTNCYILTLSSSDQSSTSFAFWLGCSTGSHWGPKPSVCSWFSLRRHPISNCNCNLNSQTRTPTDPSHLWHLVIQLFDIHLLPVGVRICTEFKHVHRSRWYFDIFDRLHLFPLFLCFIIQAHLLIDGSVEGQYVTMKALTFFLPLFLIQGLLISSA